MYKAFIIDDEPAMLDGLKLLISWQALGFELCGEASSAPEALDKLTVLRPHVVITDIRMPIGSKKPPTEPALKDGLDLIEETRKLGMQTEFIILSGYPDFDYALKAMRHSVNRYLLKPLDLDEISEALKDLKKLLDKRFLSEYGLTREDIAAFQVQAQSQSQAPALANPGESASSRAGLSADFDSQLAAAVELMNLPEATRLVGNLFAWIREQDIHPQKAIMSVHSCVYVLLRVAFDRNIRTHIDTLDFFAPKPMDWNWTEYHAIVLDILERVIRLLSEERRKHARLYLYEVKAYIDQNFHKELSVASLADMVFVDAVYLGNAFRKEFGCTISEYQHRQRIGEAARLITETDKSLAQIAALAGYNNYNNFFAHFEKITGKKPAEYRR